MEINLKNQNSINYLLRGIVNWNLAAAIIVPIIFSIPDITEANPPTNNLNSPNKGACKTLNEPGVTPGLYGLCVAYCEALDCNLDSTTPTATHPQCDKPSTKILGRYNAMKTATDPNMPCVVPPPTECSCWTQQEISQIGSTWLGDPSQYMLLWQNNYDASYGLWEYYTSGYHGAGVSYLPEPSCSYFHYDAYDPLYSSPVVRVISVSEQMAQACQVQVSSQVDYVRNTLQLTVPCIGDACQP